MEHLPIDQQSCDCQMVPLHSPKPNHLVSSSYTSFTGHNISYDIQTSFDYSLEHFDKPILTLLVISWHNSDVMHFPCSIRVTLISISIVIFWSLPKHQK